jgi:hypothetical protein
MRKLVLAFSIIFCASVFTFGLKAQQEREALLRLNRVEMETLYSIIDESATSGSVRKPLLQKLEVAYKAAFAPQQPIKADTTKPKKN